MEPFKDQIARRIKRFPRWHYLFNLKGCLTPVHKMSWVNRHLQREKYFFTPLVSLSEGTLAGKRVLDLGCNAGYWSLKAIENGCDYLLGIDARDMHVQQANFVFETLGVEKHRYQFISANVLEIDLQAFGYFDIVLFLGLLYHISKPVELMEKIAAVNSDILVIDTFLAEGGGSHLEIDFERTDDPRLAFDRELVLRPTCKAVFDMGEHFGYRVKMLEPDFNNYSGAEVYREGRRRAFICSKKTGLSEL